MTMFKHAAMFHMLFIILGISDAMQRTADHRLWFRRFGNYDRFKAMLTRGYIAIFADEIRESSALHQQLGHSRVVVSIDGQVAIGTRLGFVDAGVIRVGFVLPACSAANRMRHVGAERNAAHSIAADRLLLRIDRFAVSVVAGDVNGTA